MFFAQILTNVSALHVRTTERVKIKGTTIFAIVLVVGKDEIVI